MPDLNFNLPCSAVTILLVAVGPIEFLQIVSYKHSSSTLS